jgi:hypothetical protein
MRRLLWVRLALFFVEFRCAEEGFRFFPLADLGATERKTGCSESFVADVCVTFLLEQKKVCDTMRLT